MNTYQALAEDSNFHGHGALTQASLAASYLPEVVSRTRVDQLAVDKNVLQNLESLESTMIYLFLLSETVPAYLCSLMQAKEKFLFVKLTVFLV